MAARRTPGREPVASVASVASPTRREVLELIRAELLNELKTAPVGVKAQIAGQLRATVAELDGLAEPEAVSAIDQLAMKREARRSKRTG